MIKKLQKSLYFAKNDLRFHQGLRNGQVVPFDQAFYQQMADTYFGGLPVAMHIKYLKPESGAGKCYDRSLYMFWCFDDAVLVRGKQKSLAMEFGRDNAGHGWIERGNYAYDPTFLCRFDKDFYYRLFGVSDVHRFTKADYLASPAQSEYYHTIKNTTLRDYQPGGKRRLELLTTAPLYQELAELAHNPEFQADLNDFLTAVRYDKTKIAQEITVLESQTRDDLANNRTH